MVKSSLLLFISLFAISCINNDSRSQSEVVDQKPNILYIMLDDLAYSDLGCYGGEIHTPNIDAIAHNGQKFSGFRTAPMCGPTRAMLISGNSNHIEGMGRMINTFPVHYRYKGLENYEEDISDRIVAFPKLLQKAGYVTSVVGKWHLGWAENSKPSNHGFDNSWVLRNAASNYYNSRNYAISTPDKMDTISYYYSDGQRVEYPEGQYATEWYTDKMIEYLSKDKINDKPFFAFTSYTSPHWPLQVPQEYWDKYKGKYDIGYQELIKKRVKKLKQNGIISHDVDIPHYPDLPQWDTLSDDEKKYEARKMEIYAGMIDNVDFHIGRIIEHLKSNNLYDNTIIIIQSDNGAAAEDLSKSPYHKGGIMSWNDNSYENMNNADSFIALGKNWAQVCAAPFKKYKSTMYEGSMASPFIISGFGIPKIDKVRDEFFTIQDIAPTFLEIAGVEYPSSWEGKIMEPQRGKSIWPFINEKQDKVHNEDYVFAIEHRRSAFLRKGKWKITNQKNAAKNELFELYNLESDFSESINLALSEKNKHEELIEEWEKYKSEVGVKFLPEM